MGSPGMKRSRASRTFAMVHLPKTRGLTSALVGMVKARMTPAMVHSMPEKYTQNHSTMPKTT